MARIKEGLKEKIKVNESDSKKNAEAGQKMVREAQQVDALLKGMITDVDDSDIAIRKRAIDGYKKDFASEHAQVEQKQDILGKYNQETQKEAGAERSKVESNAQKMESASSVSDIGSRNAEQGISAIRKSAQEYDGLRDSAQAIKESADDEQKRQITELRARFNE